MTVHCPASGRSLLRSGQTNPAAGEVYTHEGRLEKARQIRHYANCQ